MHTLETSGKPRRRSEVALLNSAASSRPRSIAGTISLPGSAFTAAPMPWNRSIEMPTVRYLRPLKSSGLVIGFLNQPSGCVGIGPYGKDTTLAPIEAYSLLSSSLPPPYLCHDSSMLASMPNAGTTAPAGSTSILRSPPVMSFTFLAKSLAYSWKISFDGQVLCQRMEIGPCALAIIGKPSVAAPVAAAAAPVRNLRRDGWDWDCGLLIEVSSLWDF